MPVTAEPTTAVSNESERKVDNQLSDKVEILTTAPPKLERNKFFGDIRKIVTGKQA